MNQHKTSYHLTCKVFPDFFGTPHAPHGSIRKEYIRTIVNVKVENGLFLAVVVHRGGKYLSRSAC